MSKNKAVVCTILFAVILIGLSFGSTMIENAYGISLYALISSWTCWFCIGRSIIKFYEWLIKWRFYEVEVMWNKTVEVLNPYEAIREAIRQGEYNEKNLTFWKKVFRISYADNVFGIYKEIYVFNKKVYCNLVCRYIYE